MARSNARRRNIALHFFLQLLAYMLLLLGIAGLLLPIVPGWPLILLALVILGEESLLGGHIYRRMPSTVKSGLDRRRRRVVRQVKKI
jgi:hypothetical protein